MKGVKTTINRLRKLFFKHNGITLEFGDGSALVCDGHFMKCTWWHDHAFNDPRGQSIFFNDAVSLWKYVEEYLRVARRIIIDRDGDPVYTYRGVVGVVR